MKKFLVFLTVVAGVTAMASITAAGSNPMVKADPVADQRQARECKVLLKRMSQSPDADTWRNRMRAWPCLQRAEAAPTYMEAKR